jgi:transcription antitermination factor NusG
MSNTSALGDSQWYALYVRYRSEFKIARTLSERLGVVAEAPATQVWRKGGKAGKLIRPLLDTYVFIKANMANLARSRLLGIDGVIDLVRVNGAPAAIPDGQIESLRKLGASMAPVHEMEFRSLKPHTQVMVTRGPLAGAVGEFIRGNAGKGVFVVSLELFHRSLMTELDPSAVKPL